MRPSASILAFCAVLVLASFTLGQGPDVIVGELNGIDSYGNGGSGTIYAYAIGTTSCNIGDQRARLVWRPPTSTR